MTIPRILHHIWLGSDLPAWGAAYLESWAVKHPEWEIMRWTDGTHPNLRNEAAFSQAPSWAMKSDILRYELLARFGGVYIDADMECHASIDQLTDTPELVLVSQPTGVISNGFMGSEAGHPFLESLIHEVGVRCEKASPHDRRWPHLLTGPHLVDEIFCRESRAFDPEVVLLPQDYFFLPSTTKYGVGERSCNKRYATHHAKSSWQPNTPVKKLRQLRLKTRLRRFADLEAD